MTGTPLFVPTILRIRGYQFYFYPQEGTEPAQFHIDKGGGTIKVWLDDLSIARTKGLKTAEIRGALQLIRTHQSTLLLAWREFKRRKS